LTGGHVEGEVVQVDEALKTSAQSGTDRQESRTSPKSGANESVAEDTQQKVERPGQAEVLACADVALKKLEQVDADSKKNHNKVNAETKKRKSQIVQEFARDLEGIGFLTDRIAAEITHQLYKKVSKSLIHDCLDEKYKTSYRVENALKRKRKSLAPVVQELELKSEMVVDTSGPAAEAPQPDRGGINVEANQSVFDVNNNEGTTDTESKEESTVTPSFNDELASPIKQHENSMDTKKKVLVSHIPLSFEELRKDMMNVFKITKGVGDVFFKIWVDFETLTITIEFCGITQQKDVTMTSTGKGELKEA
jgi:hypothetical protein